MSTTRRLAAILAADVAGYSRLMATDEVGTLEALKACRREIVDPGIAEHRGRVVKTTGDGILVEFASAVDAVTCAMAVQEKMAKRGGEIVFRIGINVGDIIIDGDDIFGDGVNVAARVEGECQPGGVCLSAQAFDQVRNKTAFAFDDLGERQLKNIDRPIRIYSARSSTGAPASTTMPEPVRPLPLPDKPSIAVLPFQNMSGDPEQEYFADGMVEDIITALSRFKSLFVIARNSSFTYKGKAVDIKHVGRQLGVRYVLEGSVRKAGGRVRITGQLIEAETGSHLWADRFDSALDDVFDLQDKVATSVVGAIAPHVERAEVIRVKRKRTEDLVSYDHYLRGLAVFDINSRPAYEEARQCWEKAVEIDPDFALAWAQLGLWRFRLTAYGWSADRAGDTAVAIRCARRALEIDRNDPDVLVRAGYVIGAMGRLLQEGMPHLETALTLNPNLAVGWTWGGSLKSHLGDHDLGIEWFKRALRLSPMDSFRHVTKGLLALALLFKHRTEEAVEWGEAAIRDSPRYTPAWRAVIAGHALAGRLALAEEAVRRIREVETDASIAGFLGYTPYQRREDLDLIVAALRLAGYPE
jgi:TolB-like protein/class 3 adenylate cyclase